MSNADGMNYAPKGRSAPVVEPGQFPFAAVALDHGHINGMCNGLSEAGATLKWVYDPDETKAATLASKHPGAKVARSLDEVLDDDAVKLVAAAAVPADRADLGIAVMRRGKDYFTDKAPLTSLDQLARAKAAVAETKRKYAVYYSERLHVECAVHAGELIHQGAIGRVIQTIGLGPHRLNLPSRPDWFVQKSRYGGILCDIGSHQIEQFLAFTGASDATVVNSQVANYNNPNAPELEDFGDANLVADNGATGYFRVDWFTPDGLRTWGDGRTFILGTEGYIELRKYINVAGEADSDHLYLVNADGEQHMQLSGKVGFPFFGSLIRDCIDRTETAMTQAHAFKAAELGVIAQVQAQKVH